MLENAYGLRQQFVGTVETIHMIVTERIQKHTSLSTGRDIRKVILHVLDNRREEIQLGDVLRRLCRSVGHPYFPPDFGLSLDRDKTCYSAESILRCVTPTE